MSAAFVAGATGYTGREVVRALRARGLRAVAHVRPDSPALGRWREELGSEGVELDTTPWDEAALAATLRRLAPVAVFALLGTTRRRARAAAGRGEDATYEAVDYGLTHLLHRAAEASGVRPRFVYLSSLGVREGTANAYLAARAKVERELRAGTVPFTIARPSFITGPDRPESRPAERLGARVTDAALGLAARLGARDLAARYRSTDARTLAAALVRLALDPAAEGRVVEGDALRG